MLEGRAPINANTVREALQVDEHPELRRLVHPPHILKKIVDFVRYHAQVNLEDEQEDVVEDSVNRGRNPWAPEDYKLLATICETIQGPLIKKHVEKILKNHPVAKFILEREKIERCYMKMRNIRKQN